MFDTDILIWFSRRDAAATKFITSEQDRAASIVTLMELLAGVRSKAEVMITRQFFVDLEIRLIPIDEQISYTAARLIEDHCLSDGLNVADALIAATARESGETLATANFRHFRKIPNLSVKRFHPAR